MSDNVVEILVRSRDDAKPDMDDLRAKLDELSHKVADARVNVTDDAAAATLDKLSAQLLELDHRTANPKISMSGAIRAEAQIHAVEASLQHLDDTSAKTSTDMKARAGGFLQAAAAVTGVGDAMGAASSDAGMFSKVMAGANLATGLLEPVVVGATVAVGGLASGLVSAGAGLGVFALVAKSAYSQVSTAVQAYSTAQSTTGKASATAMKQYQAELAALTPAQRAFAEGIEGAQNAWQNFVASNTAGVTRILDKGMGLLPKILSAIQPLLAPVEQALSGIIGQLGHGLDSSGFKNFMTMLAQNTGPAITKIGDAIGHVVTGIGGILSAFMPMSQTMLGGLDSLTAKFAQWGSTLSQHTGFQSLMSTFKTETPLAVQVLKNLITVLGNVGKSMAGLSTGANSKSLLQMLVPLSNILAKLSKNQDLDRTVLYVLALVDAGKKLKTTFAGISGALQVFKTGAGMLADFKAGFTSTAAAASDATGIWGTFGGKIGDAITAVKSWGIWSKIAAAATRVWTGIQAAFDVVMDANPLILVVLAIAALVAGVILAYKHFAGFRDLVKAVFRDVTDAVKTAVDWIKGHWPLLLGILTGPIGMATLFIVQHWHQILSGAQSMINTVVGFFRALPGRILGALADLGSMMWNAGVHAIESLIGGIESMISAVGNVVGSIAGKVAGFFGLSPAKEGPLSGGGAPMIRGQHLAHDIATGMLSGLPKVAAAAGNIAGAAAGFGSLPGQGIGGAAGRAGGPAVIQLQWVGGGDDPLFQVLRHGVRVRGGNVQAVLGWGSG